MVLFIYALNSKNGDWLTNELELAWSFWTQMFGMVLSLIASNLFPLLNL